MPRGVCASCGRAADKRARLAILSGLSRSEGFVTLCDVHAERLREIEVWQRGGVAFRFVGFEGDGNGAPLSPAATPSVPPRPARERGRPNGSAGPPP